MESDLIVIGNSYQCASPLLENEFTGTVEKLYDSSALVVVKDSSKIDLDRVQDLNKRIIIPFSQFIDL